MIRKHWLIGLLCFIPMVSQAWWSMTYRVMNATTGVVKFNSTDWLDWGTRIYPGETKFNNYYMPPKNMYLTLYNQNGSPFQIETTAGCDIVGLPPLRHSGQPVTEVKGHIVRFTSGTIDIVVNELPGSTSHRKKIACSVTTSQF